MKNHKTSTNPPPKTRSEKNKQRKKSKKSKSRSRKSRSYRSITNPAIDLNQKRKKRDCREISSAVPFRSSMREDIDGNRSINRWARRRDTKTKPFPFFFSSFVVFVFLDSPSPFSFSLVFDQVFWFLGVQTLIFANTSTTERSCIRIPPTPLRHSIRQTIPISYLLSFTPIYIVYIYYYLQYRTLANSN